MSLEERTTSEMTPDNTTPAAAQEAQESQPQEAADRVESSGTTTSTPESAVVSEQKPEEPPLAAESAVAPETTASDTAIIAETPSGDTASAEPAPVETETAEQSAPVSEAGSAEETPAATPSEEAASVVEGSTPTAEEVTAAFATAVASLSTRDTAPQAGNPVHAKEAQKKVQLKPNQAGASGKAVPSIKEEKPVSGDDAIMAQAASAQTVPGAAPVEIPKVEDLDGDLESQLNAALQAPESQAKNTSGLVSPEEAGVPKDESTLEPGTKLKGKVEAIDETNIIIDLGYRASGILNQRYLTEGKLPELGAQLDVVVESVDAAEGLIHLGLLRSVHRAAGDWDSLAVGQIVECLVEKTNKGGLSVVVSQLRGFMPAGQVDLHFVGDLEPFVGQKLTAKVIDVNPKKRNLVVSRKALLQEERELVEADVWAVLQEGEQRTGTVKTLKEYGAFVDIGGLDGLLHVRELSWTRVNHPADVLQEGQQIEVKVLTIDREKKKISLGMKQLVTNPWDYAEQKYPKNTVINGLVKKITDFGAFVEIEPGLEGLIHISELDYRRVNQVNDVLKEGQEVDAQVLEINKNKKRISLSIKTLKPKPQPTAEELAHQQASIEEENARREADLKRRKTLKGGIGGNKGGGLFGNPSDY